MLPTLALGFALGAAATWFYLSSSSALPAPGSSLPAPSPAPFALSRWSWRESPTPPLLDRDPAAAAISAWLSLRSADGAPLDYAARAAALRAVLLRLPAESYPHLLDALFLLKTDDDQRLLRVAFYSWIGRDSPAAARWAYTMKLKPAFLTDEALREWSTQDPAAAADWAFSLPADSAYALPTEKVGLMLAIQALERLAPKDPARALALARSRGDDLIHIVLRILAQKDPAGTVLAHSPEFWKDGRGFWPLSGAIASWAKQDPSSALAWLITQPRKNDGELAKWLGNLRSDSPQWRRTIADAFATAPGVTGRAALLRDLMRDWSTEKPDEALAWLRQLPDSDLRLNLLVQATQVPLSDRPEQHLSLTLDIPEGAFRARRLSELLGSWTKINPDAALAWMNAHKAEPGVAEASVAMHGVLLAEIARDDPQAALAEWKKLEDPRTRLAAVPAIAQAWGARDPAAALQWLAAEPDTAKNQYYNGADLLYRWAKNDPEAALRWVETWGERAPENKLNRSAFLDALAGTWEEKAPRAATADLYSKIKDTALRTETLARHVKEWLTKDPEGARAWVSSSTALNPEQRAQILAPAR